MSEVKRYGMKTIYRGHESWDSLEEDKYGSYVSYEDYAALKTKCDELLKEIKNMHDQALDDGCRIAELEEALRDKQALIPDEHDTTARKFESLAKSE